MNCDKCGHGLDVRTELAKTLSLPPGAPADEVLLELALKEIQRLKATFPTWSGWDFGQDGTQPFLHPRTPLGVIPSPYVGDFPPGTICAGG